MAQKCLKCECPIATDDGGISGAGRLEAKFGYGSDHDQGDHWIPDPNDPNYRIDALLQCDEVRAYICDECFALFHELFEGYDEKVTFVQKLVV